MTAVDADITARRRSVLRRLAFFVAGGMVVIVGLLWRLGALRGTYEANYLARAEMLGRSDLGTLPAVVSGFSEQPMVQIESAEGKVLWENEALVAFGPSATLPRLESTVEIELDHDKSADAMGDAGRWRRVIQRLAPCPLPDGSTGWGVTLPVTTESGEHRVVTMAGTRGPYQRQWLMTAAWLGGAAMIPVAALAVFWPSRIR